MVSNEAADLIFLARSDRQPKIKCGRIQFKNEFYEHDALLELHGERVDVRYNPMTLAELHIFRGGKYLCTAMPVEYSSMIDMDLASRKIAEKRERRNRFAAEFKKISAIAPDFRQYSTVPEAERVAALVGADKKRRAIENKQLTMPVSQESIDEHIKKMESGLGLPAKTAKPLPERPGFFLDDSIHYFWLLDYLKAGGDLEAKDHQWMLDYEATMSPAGRARWQFERENVSLEAAED
jgi:hypothetical protein